MALYERADEENKAIYLKKVNHNQSVLKYRADYAEMNFGHKLALVEAEKAKVMGRLEAIEWYEKAMLLIHRNTMPMFLQFCLCSKYFPKK